MAETELDRAERRYAQAKARLQGLRNREATRQRKLDTRRKVILGGALIDLAARDDAAAAMLDRLVRNLARDQDRKAFADWTPPSGDGSDVEAGEAEDAGEKIPGPGSSQEVDLDAIEDAMSKIGQKVLRRRPGPDRA